MTLHGLPGVPCHHHTAHSNQREASFSKLETTSKTLQWSPPPAGTKLKLPPHFSRLPLTLSVPSLYLADSRPLHVLFPLPKTPLPCSQCWLRSNLPVLASESLLRLQTLPGRLPPVHLPSAHPHLKPLPSPAPSPKHPVEIGCWEPWGGEGGRPLAHSRLSMQICEPDKYKLEGSPAL